LLQLGFCRFQQFFFFYIHFILRLIKIISKLVNEILTPENLEYIYKNVEKIAAERLNEVPALLESKRGQIDKIQQEIRNYLNFVKMGNFSKSVSNALSEAEKKNEGLQQEISALEFQQGNKFKAPPEEWINYLMVLCSFQRAPAG